jgi:GNAT superfamily N-acetyltransferase
MSAVRPATAADIPAIAAVLEANDEPMDWPDLPGWPYLEHLVARARVSVAEVDGVVIGVGGAVDLGEARFLTDLYVTPSSHEHGAGRALLDAVLGHAPARMTFSSTDERALGLYIRSGMRPWWPLLYLVGEVGSLGRPPDRVEWEPASVGETARWSREWMGVDRTVDFEHYASLPASAGFLVRDEGAVVAAGWARRARREPGRWLDHVSIAPAADPVRAALGAWHAAAPAGERLMGCVPGPHPVVAVLLDAGIRIADRDQWCASDPDLIDPLRLLPNPGLL